MEDVINFQDGCSSKTNFLDSHLETATTKALPKSFKTNQDFFLRKFTRILKSKPSVTAGSAPDDYLDRRSPARRCLTKWF